MESQWRHNYYGGKKIIETNQCEDDEDVFHVITDVVFDFHEGRELHAQGSEEGSQIDNGVVVSAREDSFQHFFTLIRILTKCRELFNKSPLLFLRQVGVLRRKAVDISGFSRFL